MNEASSKYVDQIATEKLVSEKLRRSRHRTDSSSGKVDTRLDSLDECCSLPADFREGRSEGVAELHFPSFIETGFPQNDTVICRVYPAEKERGRLIFMHGLFEDNLDIYTFFVRQLNERGIRVILIMLPFHYARKPAESAFSGEFFWSGDINRSALAFKQAVYDLYRLYCNLKEWDEVPVRIAGFSMGGGVALALASRTELDGVFAINPVCNFAHLVWTSALFSTIKEDLEAQGFSQEFIARHYHSYDPLNAQEHRTPVERIAMGHALYDRINEPENYDLLIRKWNPENVISYKAGHLNILRVPKLAVDSAHMFEKGNG